MWWLYIAATAALAIALAWFAPVLLSRKRTREGACCSGEGSARETSRAASTHLSKSGRWDSGDSDDGTRLFPVRCFGLWGRAPGDLNNPRFLLNVEPGVMIADSGNDRLQAFSPEGKHLRTIHGTRPGHPTGLASDGSHLWVADSMNCSVQKCTLDGTIVCRVGVYGEGECQFSGPEGLALAHGKLFVADEGNHRIVALDAETLKWLFAFGSNGAEPGELCKPVGVSSIEEVHRGEGAASEFTIPATSKVGGAGGRVTLYVRDTGNHRICAFDTEGNFLRCFGSHGVAPGQFHCPTGMCIDRRGRVLVSDQGAPSPSGAGADGRKGRDSVCATGGSRVQVLTAEGLPLQVLPLPGCKRIYGMCVRGSYVLAADYEKHQVQVLELRRGSQPPSPQR